MCWDAAGDALSMEVLGVILEGGPDSDSEELAGLAQELRRRLLELDVETVRLARSNEIPVGAKPGEALTLGVLAVTVAAGSVRNVIDLVSVWLRTRPVRTAKVTWGGDSLELAGVSAADQQQLIDAFIDAHTGG
jgi:hypothetical protein